MSKKTKPMEGNKRTIAAQLNSFSGFTMNFLKAFGGKPFVTIPRNAVVGDSSDSDKGKVLDLSFLNIDIVQTAYIQSLMNPQS